MLLRLPVGSARPAPQRMTHVALGSRSPVRRRSAQRTWLCRLTISAI
jgi:hypothetical protein